MSSDKRSFILPLYLNRSPISIGWTNNCIFIYCRDDEWFIIFIAMNNLFKIKLLWSILKCWWSTQKMYMSVFRYYIAGCTKSKITFSLRNNSINLFEEENPKTVENKLRLWSFYFISWSLCYNQLHWTALFGLRLAFNIFTLISFSSLIILRTVGFTLQFSANVNPGFIPVSSVGILLTSVTSLISKGNVFSFAMMLIGIPAIRDKNMWATELLNYFNLLSFFLFRVNTNCTMKSVNNDGISQNENIMQILNFNFNIWPINSKEQFFFILFIFLR